MVNERRVTPRGLRSRNFSPPSPSAGGDYDDDESWRPTADEVEARWAEALGRLPSREAVRRMRPCGGGDAVASSPSSSIRRLSGEPGGIAALVRTAPRHVVRSATSSTRRGARRAARFLAVTSAPRVWQSSSRARPFPKTRQHGHVDPRKVKLSERPVPAAVRPPRARSRASRLESRRKPQPGRPAARPPHYFLRALRRPSPLVGTHPIHN